MNAVEKLRLYIEGKGIKQIWLAKQLGIDPRQLNSYLKGRESMPVKYWRKIIEVTQGEIILADLLEKHFENSSNYIEIHSDGNLNDAKISLTEEKSV